MIATVCTSSSRVFGLGLVLALAGCGPAGSTAPSSSAPVSQEDYAQLRSHFQTRLVRRGPAPQQWQPTRPPAGVREVQFPSGELRLKAWVNSPRGSAVKRPAVLFLHGGFAFGEDDWEQAQPFRDAGFITMTPMLRGENGQAGAYSMFYDEVGDVLAAADYLAQQSYVDAGRLYVAGHSVGGTLALLAALASDRFKAAASFSGSPDQRMWAQGQMQLVPFDPADATEFQARSPIAFAAFFKCPVRLYYGNLESFFRDSSQQLVARAKQAGRDVETVEVPGDHLASAEPGMRQAIQFFKERK